MTLELNQRLLNLPPSGIRKFFEILSTMEDVISLGVGEPDFNTPWNIREYAIYSLEKGHTTYTSNYGLLELRLLISKYLKQRFQVEYDAEKEILVTVGVSEAVDLVVRTLLNPGDEVIIPEPCYVSYAPLVTLAGGSPVSYKASYENNFEIKIDEIKQLVSQKTKAILINYPNNPTGATFSKSELEHLLKLARENDFYVITDEIYAELSYGRKHTCFSSLPGAKPYTILLSGFSKSFAMTGWRVGYVCAPPQILSQLVKIHQYNILCAPSIAQKAACEALTNKKDYIDEMRAQYEQRMNFMYKRFKELGFKVVKPTGAFYIFPNLEHLSMTAEDFCWKLLEEKRVAAVPGDAFGDGYEYNIRCSYAASLSQLEEAMNRIEDFVSSL